MAERDRRHIVVPNPPAYEPFTLSSGGGGGDPVLFSGDRRAHGRLLRRELEDALPPENDEPIDRGTYVTFVSFPGFELALESLDPQGSGEQPELISVGRDSTNEGVAQLATVYIPDGKREYFFKRLDAYVESLATKSLKNAKLVEGIREIRRATLRELWTDPYELYPTDGEAHWWEVWLRRRDGGELARLTNFTGVLGLSTSPHYLGFAERTVVLVRATLAQLSEAFESLDDIAELRRPHDVASLLPSLPANEQIDWARELEGRVRPAGPDAPSVCILDTGVHRTHPLLVDSLHASDEHVADPAWLLRAVLGHGTEMAGLALYGDLQAAVLSEHDVALQHRLESVKILPDQGSNSRDIYGAITARSVDRPEIEAPGRQRVFMLAVTAPRPKRPSGADPTQLERYEAGKPTSWSATIDALAFGRAIDDTDVKLTYLDRDEPPTPRLFVISAGNIVDPVATDNHLDRSDLEQVEDPAQAWNALAVGAYTDRDDMSGAHPAFSGYTPIAPRGELSPVSRTSVLFNKSKWPFKPDVIAEGGNVASSPDGSSVDTPENLAVLTTRLQEPGGGYFTTTRDTSAATAQVASIAADVQANYPGLRPETIRALVVHSAEWTPAMRAQFDQDEAKTARSMLLRRYGMGVPSLDRALRSATDALTLVAEARIQPYEREGGTAKGKVRQMNLHELPWPTEQLQELGNTDVRLRVTLSYFVEPNPSDRGWTGRYRYPSHGLRFATKRPEDSVENFRNRINKRARDAGAKPASLDTEVGWWFGSNQQQSAGSLHTDIWTGPAIDLASKGAIAVYPVAGWWKDRPQYDQSDRGVEYSLVVSIEAPSVEVDLWTPVSQQIETPVVIAS